MTRSRTPTAVALGVLENLFESRVEAGYIGDSEIDRCGDTTLNTIGVYRIEGGRLRFETAITPPPELLARRQLTGHA